VKIKVFIRKGIILKIYGCIGELYTFAGLLYEAKQGSDILQFVNGIF